MTNVFLLAGQSNMAGAGTSAEIPERLAKTPEGIRLYEDGEMRELVWRDAFGPEVGFAHGIAGEVAGPVVLCKVARGGANLRYDWNPDGTSRGEDEYRGPLYPRLIEAAKGVASSVGECAFAGMLWMQGERDSVFEDMAKVYEDNLRVFIASVRRDVGAPDVPFVTALPSPRKYNIGPGAFQHAHREIVQAAQARYVESDPNAALVKTHDLPQSDNLHFDTGGQLVLGQRFAEAMIALV